MIRIIHDALEQMVTPYEPPAIAAALGAVQFVEAVFIDGQIP